MIKYLLSKLLAQLEQIEVTLYPNQVEEIEKILEEFQVPYVKTPAESYKVACFHYVITCPDEIASFLWFCNVVC